MTNRLFNIIPASSSTYFTILGILFFMLIPFIALGFDSFKVYKTLGKTSIHFWARLGTMLLIMGVAIVFVLFAFSAGKAKFILTEQGLVIKSFIYGRTLPKNIFSNNEPLILDLRNQKDYAPIIKTNGIVLPGYKAGWFRLTNKKKALVFVTDKSRLVYLPTNNDYSILLSVIEPKEFIDTLQNFWKD